MLNVFEDEIRSMIVARAEVCKKIRSDDIGELVNTIIRYLQYFNSLGEFERYCFEYRDFGEIIIPNEFSAFITPRCVKFYPNVRQCVDLLVRPESVSEYPFNFIEWYETCIKWRALFKKDITGDVSTLADLKVEKALSDMIDKAGFIFKEGKKLDSFARYIDHPYVPIHLKGIVAQALLRDDYFNSDCMTVIRDYLSAVVY